MADKIISEEELKKIISVFEWGMIGVSGNVTPAGQEGLTAIRHALEDLKEL